MKRVLCKLCMYRREREWWKREEKSGQGGTHKGERRNQTKGVPTYTVRKLKVESGNESTGGGKSSGVKYMNDLETVYLDHSMPELRQRTTQGPVSGIEKPQAAGARYQKAARPPPKRPTRHIHISITLLILACFILYANNQRLAPKPAVVFHTGLKDLPEWYGICSKEGKRIYTVPEDGGLGEVECVVVGGKEVRDIGSLGESPNE